MNDDPASELERLALRLLAIPSVIEHEAEIAGFCHAWLEEQGVHGLTRAGDNIACQPRPFRDGTPRVLLLGHLDTVPVSDENTPRIEGGRIHGLGSSDMKCADALILDLVRGAVDREPRYDLAAVLYAREEGPYEGSGLPELMAAAPGSFKGVDLAVAMEPTGNCIELGCLGTMHARVRFLGKRAHSGRPWEGENAIHLAAPLLGYLASLEPRDVDFDGLLFRESCSATMIEYEGARNVVPESCTVNLNFRYAPDRTADEAVLWLQEMVAGCSGRELLEAGKLRIEISDLCPSGRIPRDNPLLESLRGSGEGALPVKAKQAWTDVGRLSQMGLDAVNLGPGLPSQAHQRGEYCERRSLAECKRLMEAWLWG